MFAGIARGQFPVNVERRPDGITALRVQLRDYQAGLVRGASVAVNGVCLTVVSCDSTGVGFEVGKETARISNLGSLQTGSLVNVERSIQAGEEIGGHLVSGHIACKVEVVSFERDGEEASLSFLVPREWCDYVMNRGFVALNGCSLTVAEFDRETRLGSINLIPETLRVTTFGEQQIGDELNLEVDHQTQAIVETVKTMLSDSSWVKSLQ